MPIAPRRLSCVTLRMSWPSMRMLPCPELVKAQQQVDERGLAGARTADDADALAGPDPRFRSASTAPRVAAAVGEGQVLDRDLAARDLEHARARSSTSGAGTAIVSMPSCDADVLEDAGHLPSSPSRRRWRSSRPAAARSRPRRADLARPPQRDPDRRRATSSSAFIVDSVASEGGDQAHVAAIAAVCRRSRRARTRPRRGRARTA